LAISKLKEEDGEGGGIIDALPLPLPIFPMLSE
jgi:hypothetical protein